MQPPSPSPIQPPTVSAFLDLAVDLDAPLPPDLISRPLLQRHHFLGITVEDPVQYLAWPGDKDAPHAVQLLRSFHRPPDDLQFIAQYSADPECLHAHVQITNAAEESAKHFRLIFQWNSSLGWQYHNIALMPFPPTAYSAFDDALRIFHSESDFLPEQVSIVGGDEEDDAYWNSYGDNDDAPPSSKPIAKAHTPLNEEDAYWARYSSIHGTADSTVPSPLPNKRTFEEQSEERIMLPSEPFHIPTEVYNPLEPPSPETLAKRLAELSVRPASPPIEDEDASTDSETASPRHVETDLELVDSTSTSDGSPLDTSTSSQALSEADDDDESDLALQQAIQSVYRLWKADRKRKALDVDCEVFLSLARSVIQA